MLDILLIVINLIIYEVSLFIWYTIIIMKCLSLKQPFADLLARVVSPLFIKLILVTKQEVHWGSCMYNMSSSLVFSVQRAPNRTSFKSLDDIVNKVIYKFFNMLSFY
jgi:hypothetical protein